MSDFTPEYFARQGAHLSVVPWEGGDYFRITLGAFAAQSPESWANAANILAHLIVGEALRESA